MDQMTRFTLLVAFIWGGVWAAFLQWTEMGRFLVRRHTWITVVVGVGGDLLLAGLCVPFEWWWRVAAIVMLSGVGIVVRSLANQRADERTLMEILLRGGDVDDESDEAGK